MTELSVGVLIICVVSTCICCILRRMGRKYYDEIDNVFNEMIPHTECIKEDEEGEEEW